MEEKRECSDKAKVTDEAEGIQKNVVQVKSRYGRHRYARLRRPNMRWERGASRGVTLRPKKA